LAVEEDKEFYRNLKEIMKMCIKFCTKNRKNEQTLKLAYIHVGRVRVKRLDLIRILELDLKSSTQTRGSIFSQLLGSRRTLNKTLRTGHKGYQ